MKTVWDGSTRQRHTVYSCTLYVQYYSLYVSTIKYCTVVYYSTVAYYSTVVPATVLLCTNTQRLQYTYCTLTTLPQSWTTSSPSPCQQSMPQSTCKKFLSHSSQLAVQFVRRRRRTNLTAPGGAPEFPCRPAIYQPSWTIKASSSS